MASVASPITGSVLVPEQLLMDTPPPPPPPQPSSGMSCVKASIQGSLTTINTTGKTLATASGAKHAASVAYKIMDIVAVAGVIFTAGAAIVSETLKAFVVWVNLFDLVIKFNTWLKDSDNRTWFGTVALTSITAVRLLGLMTFLDRVKAINWSNIVSYIGGFAVFTPIFSTLGIAGFTCDSIDSGLQISKRKTEALACNLAREYWQEEADKQSANLPPTVRQLEIIAEFNDSATGETGLRGRLVKKGFKETSPLVRDVDFIIKGTWNNRAQIFSNAQDLTSLEDAKTHYEVHKFTVLHRNAQIEIRKHTINIVADIIEIVGIILGVALIAVSPWVLAIALIISTMSLIKAVYDKYYDTSDHPGMRLPQKPIEVELYDNLNACGLLMHGQTIGAVDNEATGDGNDLADNPFETNAPPENGDAGGPHNTSDSNDGTDGSDDEPNV